MVAPLNPSEIPDSLRPFAGNDVIYMRFMDKISSRKKRQRRVVAVTSNSIVLADPKSGNVKRFFTNEDIAGMFWQDVPRQKGGPERHIVFKVNGEHDLALSQVDDRRNPPGSHAADPEMVEKIPEWVRDTTGREIPVVDVPLQRDIISESDRQRRPGYNEKRDKQFREIHEAAKRRRAEARDTSQLSITPTTAPIDHQQQLADAAGEPGHAGHLPTPLLRPATPTTDGGSEAGLPLEALDEPADAAALAELQQQRRGAGSPNTNPQHHPPHHAPSSAHTLAPVPSPGGPSRAEARQSAQSAAPILPSRPASIVGGQQEGAQPQYPTQQHPAPAEAVMAAVASEMMGRDTPVGRGGGGGSSHPGSARGSLPPAPPQRYPSLQQQGGGGGGGGALSPGSAASSQQHHHPQRVGGASPPWRHSVPISTWGADTPPRVGGGLAGGVGHHPSTHSWGGLAGSSPSGSFRGGGAAVVSRRDAALSPMVSPADGRLGLGVGGGEVEALRREADVLRAELAEARGGGGAKLLDPILQQMQAQQACMAEMQAEMARQQRRGGGEAAPAQPDPRVAELEEQVHSLTLAVSHLHRDVGEARGLAEGAAVAAAAAAATAEQQQQLLLHRRDYPQLQQHPPLELPTPLPRTPTMGSPYGRDAGDAAWRGGGGGGGGVGGGGIATPSPSPPPVAPKLSPAPPSPWRGGGRWGGGGGGGEGVGIAHYNAAHQPPQTPPRWRAGGAYGDGGEEEGRDALDEPLRVPYSPPSAAQQMQMQVQLQQRATPSLSIDVREEVHDGPLPEAQVIPAGKYVGPFPVGSPVTITHDEQGNTRVLIASPGGAGIAEGEFANPNYPVADSPPRASGVGSGGGGGGGVDPPAPSEEGSAAGDGGDLHTSTVGPATAEEAGAAVVLETPGRQMGEYLERIQPGGMAAMQQQQQGGGGGGADGRGREEVVSRSHQRQAEGRGVSGAGASLEDSLPSKMLSEDFRRQQPSSDIRGGQPQPLVMHVAGSATTPLKMQVEDSPLDQALRRAQRTTAQTLAHQRAPPPPRQGSQLTAMSPGLGSFATPPPAQRAVQQLQQQHATPGHPQQAPHPPAATAAAVPAALSRRQHGRHLDAAPPRQVPPPSTPVQQQQQQQRAAATTPGSTATATVAEQIQQLAQLGALLQQQQHRPAPAKAQDPAGSISHSAAELQSQLASAQAAMQALLGDEMARLGSSGARVPPHSGGAAAQHLQQQQQQQHAALAPGVGVAPPAPMWGPGSAGPHVAKPRAAVIEGARLLKESLADIQKAGRAMHFAEALSVLSMDALVTVLSEFVPSHLKRGLDANWRAIITQYQMRARSRLHLREQALHAQLQGDVPQQQQGDLGQALPQHFAHLG